MVAHNLSKITTIVCITISHLDTLNTWKVIRRPLNGGNERFYTLHSTSGIVEQNSYVIITLMPLAILSYDSYTLH